MAKTKQIQELLKILKNDGWISVFNEQSGIYYNNGYVLVYGDSHDTQPDCVSMQNVFSRFIKEDLLGASDWFIEHDGFLLAQGNITPRLLEAQQIGESDPRYKDWLKQITMIRDVVNFSRNQELQHRMIMGFITTNGNVCKYVAHNGPVRDTMIFKFTRDVPVCEQGGVIGDVSSYKEGQLFRVVNVVDNKIQIKEVSDDEQGGRVCLLGPREFKELEEAGDITAMEPLITVGKVQRRSLVPVYEGQVADIPKELYKFRISDRQQLGKAIARCMNITALLVTSITMTDELLEALASTNEDVSVLFSTNIDEKSSKVIAQLVRAKLNINRFIQGAVDADYLQLQMHDFDYEFDAFVREVKFDNAYIGLIREMYSWGIQDVENNVFAQYIKFKGNQLGLINTSEYLLSDGLYTPTSVFIRWSTLKDRSELYAFFAATGLEIAGVLWSELLSRIMNNGLYLAYDMKGGFIIQIGNYWLGRDYNSLVFYDAALNPVWRALKINETYIQYGDFPVKYLIN